MSHPRTTPGDSAPPTARCPAWRAWGRAAARTSERNPRADRATMRRKPRPPAGLPRCECLARGCAFRHPPCVNTPPSLFALPCFAHPLIRAQKQREAFRTQFGAACPSGRATSASPVHPALVSNRLAPSRSAPARASGSSRALPGIGFLGGLILALALKHPPEQIQQLGMMRMDFDGLLQSVFPRVVCLRATGP